MTALESHAVVSTLTLTVDLILIKLIVALIENLTS